MTTIPSTEAIKLIYKLLDDVLESPIDPKDRSLSGTRFLPGPT